MFIFVLFKQWKFTIKNCGTQIAGVEGEYVDHLTSSTVQRKQLFQHRLAIIGFKLQLLTVPQKLQPSIHFIFTFISKSSFTVLSFNFSVWLLPSLLLSLSLSSFVCSSFFFASDRARQVTTSFFVVRWFRQSTSFCFCLRAFLFGRFKSIFLSLHTYVLVYLCPCVPMTFRIYFPFIPTSIHTYVYPCHP